MFFSILSAIGLILLTMVGYSFGAILSAGKKDPTPRVIDLILLLVLWVVGFLVRGSLGHGLSIFVFWLAGLIIGYVVVGMRKNQFFDAPQEHFAQLDPSWSLPKQLWERWKVFGARFGHFQSRIMMGYFYFVVISWVGLPVRLFSDFLGMKSTPSGSGWSDKMPDDVTVEAAQNQY